MLNESHSSYRSASSPVKSICHQQKTLLLVDGNIVVLPSVYVGETY
jgi:hypothetical protein